MTLTPVGGGRFEISLNGEQLYSRHHPPQTDKAAGDIYAVVDLAQQIRTKLLSALKAAETAAK